MYVTDDKLPDDVLRKAYDETRHALCCSECNSESFFDPRWPQAIGKPLMALVLHENEGRSPLSVQ
jgi:hypothetical protein